MKLAALFAAFIACGAPLAPVAAQTDPPSPFSDPAWGRTTASAEELAEKIAAIEAAIAAQDEETLVLAVLRVRTYDNVDLIPVLERVIALPTWPCDVAKAEAIVDERHPHRVAESTGIELSSSEMDARVRAFEEWRPYGVAAVTYGTAGRKAEVAVGHFMERGDRAAYDAVARCFDRSEIASDPAKASHMIAALLTFDDVAPELEERMLSRMLAVDELSPELLKFTEFPPYAAPPPRNSYVHALPAVSVARSLIRARTRSKSALLALADGLMLGSSRFAEDVESTERLCVDDPALAVSAKVGRLCASVLEAQFGEPFTWADAVSRDKVRDRIEREFPDAKRPQRTVPDAANVTASIAAIEAALAARDGEALDLALAAVLPFQSDAVLATYGRVLVAEPFPSDVASATEEVERKLAEFLNGTSNPTHTSAAARWRATGIEVETCRFSSDRCTRVCEALAARGDEAAHQVLVEALASTTLRANPLAHAAVIRTLASFTFTSAELERELRRLVRTAKSVDKSFTTWTSRPCPTAMSDLARSGEIDAALCPRITPYLEAARYFAVRKTKSRMVLEVLVEGLMFGFDSKQKRNVAGFPHHSDPAIELSRLVGAECRDALQACTGVRCDVLSKSSQRAAESWLQREARIRGFE